MYSNLWYPMIRSEDLSPGKPEKVKVLGLHFAVYRTDAGEPIVLSDTCVHRGGSLSGPW
jgi:5,5'-dehydrodivanillate O-demethylase